MAIKYNVSLVGKDAVNFERYLKDENIPYNKKESDEVQKERKAPIISSMPIKVDLTSKIDFVRSENEMNEFFKWSSRTTDFLNVYLKNVYGLSFNDGYMQGFSAKSAILYDQFLKEVGIKKRIATSGQLEKNLKLIENEASVGDGLLLVGYHGNSLEDKQIEYLIEQFQRKGLAKTDDIGRLIKPIQMELRGLELDKKTGLFNLTDESIYREISDLAEKNFKFEKRDNFGVPIEKKDAKRLAISHGGLRGLYATGIWDDLDFGLGFSRQGHLPNNGRITVSE